MIYLAARFSPAAELGEAAALEGASRRAFFWRVTFPSAGRPRCSSSSTP